MKKLSQVLFLCLLSTILLAQENENPFENLKWREIGPANMGGRVSAIAGVSGDPSTFYVGGADGGVFKTVNGGTTFEAKFDDQRAYSVGALAVAPSDENVIWLGSGEGDPRNSVGYGNGVYRSLDGGDTWQHLGLDRTERIKRIVVHPDNPDVACVCALGREWGANPERGVFQTKDGGKSWKKVLYINNETGCSDLDIDLTNPRFMYAGMWTFGRKPWRFDGGGRETAVYRTMDGGDTWEKIMKGLPDGPMARIGLSVAQSNPETIFMITEFPDLAGTLFRSDDRGGKWQVVNKNPNINFRPFYYSDVFVDPNRPNIIYTLSGRLSKSVDGGQTFKTIGKDVHGDHQSYWIDPVNSDRLLSGSDGGYQVSWDQGEHWDVINNVALSQFYQLDIDMKQPYNVYGGLQDNGCWRGPSNSLVGKGILKRHWKRLSYGDGYYAVPVPGREHEVYTNLQGGVPFHVNAKTGVVRSIHPFPKIIGSAGDAIENHKYRFNWDSPIYISPHDPNTVYFGGNVLFKSQDKGHSWEEISSDLTTNDKEKQRTSGGEIYQDNTAAEFHCSILTIAESPLESGVIYVGTDDGNLQVTRDGGSNWTNVNSKLLGLPSFAWMGKIHASETEKGTAYLAVDNHRSDDFRPHAYMTSDYGQSWKRIVNGLPNDDYVKVIRQDPHDSNVLYIGMEHGVYISWDKGGSWTRINNNLPPVSVRDLRIHPRERDIIVGTHGRGVWILDDAQTLAGWTNMQDFEMHIGEVKPAIRWHMYTQMENMGQSAYIAKNPKYGAMVDVVLKEKKDEPIVMNIYDQWGGLVRMIEDSQSVTGVNRLVWDLRREGAPKLDNPPKSAWGGNTMRPMVAPGEYNAVVTCGTLKKETSITVKADPRLEVEQEIYVAQADAMRNLVGTLTEMHDLINESDWILDQLLHLKKGLKRENLDISENATKMKMIKEAIAEVHVQREVWMRPPPNMTYRQTPGLRDEIRSLMRAIDGAPSAPTMPQLGRVETLKEELSAAQNNFERYKNDMILKINNAIGKSQAVMVKKAKP